MPHTVPEGGTDGCVCHVPDLKGLVQWWGGQAHRGTVHQTWGWPLSRPREDNSMNQTLLLPTRSSPSRGRGKYSNKWLWRWRNVCFPNLKDFWFSCILTKNPSGGWKPLIGISVTGRYYLWSEGPFKCVPCEGVPCRRWPSKMWRTTMCSGAPCGHSACRMMVPWWLWLVQDSPSRPLFMTRG